jgi:hypothetical protein
MCVVVLLFNTSFFVNEYPIFALLSSLLLSQTKDIDIIPRSMTNYGLFITHFFSDLEFEFFVLKYETFKKISRS